MTVVRYIKASGKHGERCFSDRDFIDALRGALGMKPLYAACCEVDMQPAPLPLPPPYRSPLWKRALDLRLKSKGFHVRA